VCLDLLCEYHFGRRQFSRYKGIAGACGDGEDLKHVRIELSESMMEKNMPLNQGFEP
jgi:hypothetical protein